MAELALAIIPLGIQACSGLVSYLTGLKDRDDALTRLTRQAESLEGTFRSLDSFLKRGQLEPETSQAAANALSCLKHCQDGLMDLRDFEQKLSSPVAPTKVQDKMKEGIRKLRYPLQQSQLEQLEKALDCLCTPLNLAVQNLQLELEVVNSSVLVQNTTRIQQTGDAISSLSTAVIGLNGPISDIQSQVPLLRGSVNAFVPQVNLAIQTQLQAQMEEIRLSFQEAESAALRRNVEINELLSQLHLQDRKQIPAIYKLASQPSALASLAASTSACYCRAKRLRTRKTLNLGFLHLTDEMMSEIPHFKDCNYYTAYGKYSRTRTVRFTGLTKLINRAIDLTFCTTTGAGGFSISPSFTYFPMVDEERAPVFRVLSLLFQTGWELLDFDDSDSHSNKYFQAALHKLQDIFRSGKAGPTDMTSGGDSILHQFVPLAIMWPLSISPGLDALLHLFLTVGTPVSTRGYRGLTPFHIAALHPETPKSIMTQLCVDDVAMPLQPAFTASAVTAENFPWHEGTSPGITEALVGPLGIAIIRNDREAVDQLLNSCPDILEELSFYGETPFSMAIDKPDILELLVKKASPEQLVQRSCIPRLQTSLLGQAMRLSYQVCETSGTADGSLCPCTASVKVILAGDYPIIPYRDFWHCGHNNFTNASIHCKVLVANQLRTRRRRLRQLAQEKLLHSEFSPFYSSTAELDFQAIELDQLLSGQGLVGLCSLSTVLPDDLSETSTGERCSRPIYLDITGSGDVTIFQGLGFLPTPEDEVNFLDLGFLDVNYTLQYEWPEKLTPQGHRVGLTEFICRLPLQHVIWLHDHCPDIWRWICQGHKQTGLPFILADSIGLRTYLIIDHLNTETESIAADLLTTETMDDCVCQCSPGGCTPFALRMKWLAVKFSYEVPDRGYIADRERAEMYQSYLEDYGKTLSLDQHVVIVRQATFEALGMTHTCIDIPRRDIHLEPDDIEFEINHYDVEKARCLDGLVIEFRDFMLSDDSAAGCEAGKGANTGGRSLHDEGAVRCRRAVEYWGEVWLSKVHGIEESLAVAWSPDYQVLGDLGVSLWSEDDEKKEKDAETVDDKCIRIFNEFMEKLEMID
ncbi:hypothetical protein FSARC_9842 [Fusarium sarcochroum]|uniref:Fungal N-terminal domain-containing protein n=1 Tax=Fusarium sarcochroum TaxID=1208366 RepID=A0A8H4TQH0_9HYPO|nr:hypothetical protein FSARC_9842 [Fusarium sarcochroum]